MTRAISDDKLAVAYMEAIAAALDETSLQFGARGDMGAALAALSACQAQLLSTIKDGKARKFMREDCGKKLQKYLVASMGDDKRGIHKPALAVLPPKIH